MYLWVPYFCLLSAYLWFFVSICSSMWFSPCLVFFFGRRKMCLHRHWMQKMPSTEVAHFHTIRRLCFVLLCPPHQTTNLKFMSHYFAKVIIVHIIISEGFDSRPIPINYLGRWFYGFFAEFHRCVDALSKSKTKCHVHVDAFIQSHTQHIQVMVWDQAFACFLVSSPPPTTRPSFLFQKRKKQISFYHLGCIRGNLPRMCFLRISAHPRCGMLQFLVGQQWEKFAESCPAQILLNNPYLHNLQIFFGSVFIVQVFFWFCWF